MRVNSNAQAKTATRPNQWLGNRVKFDPVFEGCVITSEDTFNCGNCSCSQGYQLLSHARRISDCLMNRLLNCRQAAADASYSESLSILIGKTIAFSGSAVTVMRPGESRIGGRKSIGFAQESVQLSV